MNRIRLLSEQVANQIAAGEVVERPSSVVKELVENSLDARATRIVVEVQAGGRSLIRVTDDGVGMGRDDALLCLERHATSKIQKASDLSSIATMGFRGEALPSIASVSRFTLTTREREGGELEATQVVIQGGKIVEVRTAGAPAGTSMEVRQLFYNVPARKKFLRSEETEFGHIHHYITLAALAYPDVGFTLIKDSKTLLQLPPSKPASGPDAAAAAFGPLGERLRSLLGGEDTLLPLDYTTELSEIHSSTVARDPEAFQDLRSRRLRVWGFIGRPGVSRSTRDQHYIFVNRRPVDNRGIHFALVEGYHTSLMKGRYPVCCLFLEIDPARVDVNIHPTKREVKFHNEGEIRRCTADAVKQTLLGFHRSHPDLSRSGQDPELAEPVESGPVVSQPILIEVTPTPPSPGISGNADRAREAWVPSTPAVGVAAAFPSPAPAIAPPPPAPPAVVRPESPDPARAPVFATPAPAHPVATGSDAGPVFRAPTPTAGTPTKPSAVAPQPLLRVPLRIVGVVGRLYVLLESDRGLVLMDQHAAHERILFEQMLNRLEQGQAASQRLLLPETVEIPSRDAQFLRELIPTLTRMGIGLSEFGDRTFILDALPPFAKARDPRQFVLGLVDELRQSGLTVNTLRLGEDVIAKTVCRHAVKANDPLKMEELAGLLADLKRCSMPYTCPHGRPTLIEMSFRDLEKRFGRLV